MKHKPQLVALGKLAPPRLARVVVRERLFERLDEFATRPIVWLSGAPGSGKTTLAASYLAARKRRLLWLLLDRADADAATFFHFVSLAAALAQPRRALKLPALSNEDLHDLSGFARRYVRSLCERIEPPWVLVLDNYQELNADSALHQALRDAVDELPSGVQIMVISRSPPPAHFARALVNQQVGLIDAVALKFTIDETRGLLSMHGRRQDAAPLQEAVGGWAAGLVLLLLADPGAQSVAIEDNARSRQVLFDYFAGEVFDQMAVADREVLLRVASLPNTTAAMANAISETSAAARILSELFQRNLFVDRRDGAEPVYVFHALFRNFLLTRAKATFSEAQMDALRLLAAGLLADHGQIDAAMEHLLQANAWPRAERLLHEHVASYVTQERTQPICAWIGLLPQAMQHSPRNTYWRAYCNMVLDPATALEGFNDAYQGFTDQAEPIGQLLCAAGAAESIVLLGTDQVTLDRWIQVFEALAAHYFEIRDLATELRVLPGMLAAFVARQSQHRLTGILADRAEQLLEQEPAASQRILFSAAANCFIDTGQHERLGRIIAKFERLRMTAHIAPMSALRWRNAQIYWKTLVGRTDEAIIDADEAERLVASPGMARLADATHLAAAQAAWGVGDSTRAGRHLSIARALIDPTRSYERSVLEFLSGVVAVQQGDFSTGVRYLTVAAALAREVGSPGRERVAHFALCLATTEAGAYEAAQAALSAAKSHPSFSVSPFHQWVIAIIEANLADRLGDTARCLQSLSQGLRLAREHAYSYAPGLFATGIMPRMCAIALQNGIDVAFVRQLITQRGLRAPSLAITAWPWPIRVQTLGRFLIERDQQALPTTRKEQRKPLEMLRLLIAQGGSGVSSKQLAHWLWPDAVGDAAQNSFDNALHRLRKLLGDDRFVRHHDGALTLDATLCWVDTRALEVCFAASDTLLSGSSSNGNFDAYRSRDADRNLDANQSLDAMASHVLALYQGPFLRGDDSHPVILAARDRLSSRFVRQLTAIASHHERDGRWQRAAELYLSLLEHNPLAEDTYRRLIRCHLHQGRPAEAFDAYRRCRDNLSIILGIKPSQETEQLLARLRNDQV